VSAHGHRHDRGADFDWDAMADALEIDGGLVLPLVETVCSDLARAGIDPASVARVVDAGCGPGLVTCALAELFPTARVTGIDSAGQLLDRLRARALAAGVADRVDGVEADLEHDLPPIGSADLAWASMVVHHVGDPVATLRRLGGLLRPGGTLVVVEFGGNPTALPDDDPVVASGAWARLEAGAMASLAELLGPDVIGRDWPRDLRLAGLVDVTDDVVPFSYDAPLDELRRRWLVRHVRRGRGMAGEALTPGDIELLDAFAGAVETGDRADAFVQADRRVLTARRPG
jgi:SAM-dependent methyltransferase